MQQSFLRETAGVIMRTFVVTGSIFLTIILISHYFTYVYEPAASISYQGCNIAVLPIEGAILPFHGLSDFDLITTPEMVEDFMHRAEADPEIKAVLLEINSPGGTPVASERIATRFKESSLPVIGMIGDVAASGGYMVASAADFLIASPLSDVGSIGVNMSYLEESNKHAEEGVTYVQLIAGEYKDIGSPDRPITEEERALLQKDLNLIHDEFISIVALNRDLDEDYVRGLADGLTMPGVRALEADLVDSLGSTKETTEVLASVLELEIEDISYCEPDAKQLISW